METLTLMNKNEIEYWKHRLKAHPYTYGITIQYGDARAAGEWGAVWNACKGFINAVEWQDEFAYGILFMAVGKRAHAHGVLHTDDLGHRFLRECMTEGGWLNVRPLYDQDGWINYITGQAAAIEFLSIGDCGLWQGNEFRYPEMV